MSIKKAFTLIELMIVMAIIAVLATLIITAISITRRNTRDTQRRNIVKIIKTHLEEYYAAEHISITGDKHTYPLPPVSPLCNLDCINGLFDPNLGLTDPLGQADRYCYAYNTPNTYRLRVVTEGSGITPPTASCIGTHIGEDFDLMP